MENIGEYLDQKVIDEMINIKSVDQTIGILSSIYICNVGLHGGGYKGHSRTHSPLKYGTPFTHSVPLNQETPPENRFFIFSFCGKIQVTP